VIPMTLTIGEQAERYLLRVNDDMLRQPAGNCSRGAHEGCLHRIDCPCECHDAQH
jgi:hypothetical protein